MNRRVTTVILGTIILITFIEISVYFGYLFVKGNNIPNFFVTASDLFTPVQRGLYIVQSEEAKTYYPDRIESFLSLMQGFITKNNAFLKVAETRLALAGEVSEINKFSDEKVKDFFGYEITLKNNKNEVLKVKLEPNEILYAKVYSTQQTNTNLSKSKKAIEDIKVGDYIVISKAISLLSADETHIDIEILVPTR